MQKFSSILILVFILFGLTCYYRFINSLRWVFKPPQILRAYTFTCNAIENKTAFEQEIKINASILNSSNCIREHFKTTLLIVVYNSPVYSHLPLLQNLYKYGFPNIIHCGPDHLTAPSWVLKGVTASGYFTYDECAARSMRIFFNYSGYLVINDDLFLNFLNIRKFNLLKIWEGPILVEDNRRKPSDWWWWNTQWGVKNCFKVLDKLRSINKYYYQKKDPYWHKMVSGENVCYGIRADIYYIPQIMSKNFTDLSSLFREENVFLEIAVPTIIRMLATEVERLNGFYMDRGTKSEVILKSYSSDLNFIHPIKFNYGKESLVNFEFLKVYERNVSNIITC